MRVLQIMAGRENGGAETAFVDTVTALHKSGLDQKIVIKKGAPVLERFQKAGLSAIELPFKKWFDFSTQKELSTLIKEYRPQIVQTWMNRASSLCPQGDFIRVGWFGGYYPKKHYTNCDYLVGVTPDIVKHQQGLGWPKEKTEVLRTFAPYEEGEALRKEAFDTPEKAPVLLALARLHPKKGLDLLIKALKDIPEAYLWIAGEGPLKSELKNLTEEVGVADRVRFLGWRTDRGALLRTCDICTFPSRYEPFGTVMVEAWMYGAPLVTAESAGPKAHVKNRENGMIVPIDRVDLLRDAIREVLKSETLRTRIVQGGTETFKTLFTEDAVVKAYRSFYDRIAP